MSQAQPVGQQQFVPTIPNATTLYTASGAPVQIINVDSNVNDGTYHGYKAPTAKILGILQILLGLIAMICQIIITAIKSGSYEGFAGIWAPVVFIIAGAFGIHSAKTKSQCSVITAMVLSIVAAVLAIGPIIQGSTGVAHAHFRCHWVYNDYENNYPSCFTFPRNRVGAAFHAVMIFTALTEAIVAIVAAAYCCHGCCYRPRSGAVPGQGVGGMQMAAVYYQHMPANRPSPATTVTVDPNADPVQAGALPAYGSATPPPQYTEKAPL